MNKVLKIAFIALASGSFLLPALANDHQSYALDKLANAEAQLDKLVIQKKALNDYIKAVRKDLKAARIRARAERIQLEADTDRQDAAALVEQSGVAVDLPNMMTAKGVQAGLLDNNEYKAEHVESMFKDRNKEATKSVYFPGGSKGKKVEPINPR